MKLEIWNVSKHTYVVWENMPFSTKTHLNLLMSAFFVKDSTATQSNRMRVVLKIL